MKTFDVTEVTSRENERPALACRISETNGLECRNESFLWRLSSMLRGRITGRSFRLLLVAVVAAGVSAQQPQSHPRIGVPEDWTHHHIFFSGEYLRAHPEVAALEPRA